MRIRGTVVEDKRGRELSAAVDLACQHLAGRALLREEAVQLLSQHLPDSTNGLEVLQLAALQGKVQLTTAVAPAPQKPWRLLRRSKQRLHCRRCGSHEDKMRRTYCAACGNMCAYCEACLTLGRSRECELLVIGAPDHSQVGLPGPAATPDLIQRWGLSPAQSAAAGAALQFISRPHAESATPQNFLLWAVTGAGKTEMIFPLLDAVLSKGGRALVATPRRDVVLELAPRLAKAFPNRTMTTLYGGSKERWESGDLTVATTHQLLRFQEAFDLVIIDELDAFPYHNDPMLQFAANKCCKKFGSTLFLSATPPAAMQRAAARGRLPCARVPVRFHQHPLPVPKRMAMPPATRWLSKRKLPSHVAKPITESIRRGAQIFLFVPYVRQVAPLVNLLRDCSPQLGIEPQHIDGTSSKDLQRADKVTFFRNRTIQLLVTTTILERGVTVPKSDVFVLDADNPLFDSASLVQMAGRAGRSAEDPHGRVYFASNSLTISQRGAIRQIRSMNRLARKQGYLL
ncbi:DEAD/DEAH box helicase [Cohnella kolymensis]|uniref:DEAD/DEAH box helicase n=1 Tax=Cohnella kolymensis TaxID=1590652 RepID=UPI0009E41B4F|nr:helicase-related protein [Cohnella kolymensis]